MPHTQHSTYFSYNLALIAGLVGGTIEILWLMFFTRFLPINLAEVARETALSVYIFSQTSEWLIFWGIGVHLALSSAVAVLFAYIMNRAPDILQRHTFIPLLSILFLLMIWIVEFIMILPILSPRLIELLPLSATLISKFLFGYGMGITFVWSNEGRAERIPSLNKRSQH
jgi:hypothetical protein